MLVINQKRVKIILGCILVAVFTFSLQVANKEEKNNTENKTIATTATPVSGKTVVLDAGHGKPDEGTYLLTLYSN